MTSSPENLTGSGTTSAITVAGLRTAELHVHGHGQNAAGAGAASATSNPVTPRTPSPARPTGVVATAGNGQATVSFTAPASDGGAPITDYTVTSSPGNITATAPASPITVTGPDQRRQSYTFTVTATNAIGDGPALGASNSVTPTLVAVAPGAPTGVTATAGNGTP